ncbi:MAG: hypothetical protein AAGN66_08895 [Acidobacteriota bacterium]
MALLVCTGSRSSTDWTNKVAYLGQSYYSCLVDKCWRSATFPWLSKIASLDYGGKLTIVPETSAELVAELDAFDPAGTMEGTKTLRRVCEETAASGKTLWISGDMYPVLTREGR